MLDPCRIDILNYLLTICDYLILFQYDSLDDLKGLLSVCCQDVEAIVQCQKYELQQKWHQLSKHPQCLTNRVITWHYSQG